MDQLYKYFRFVYVLNIIASFIFIILIPFTSPVYSAADYGKQSLIGNDFSNTNLEGATFYLTNLQDADLSGSNLKGASFFDAKLQGTNLSNSNLENTTLDSAIFDGANLSNAYLVDSFAFNTKFTNVIIDGADFTNVLLSKDQNNYLCSIAEGINPISKKNTKETLDCN